jgi:prepilin-type N-terminal cleavage/methylation domain-containing protein
MRAGSSLERGLPPSRGAPDNQIVNGPAVSVARRLLRRLGSERGFTLVELLASMSILLVVLAALVSVTTSGSKAEHELNLRFQAQEEARLGLDVFRREVHNACGATVAPGGNQVTLKSNAQTGSFPCTLVGSNWCTSGSGTRFALYRQAGAAACGTGVRRADHLVSGAIFSLPTATAGQLPKISIDLIVNREPATARLNYRLDDAVALRNARRG